VGCPYERSHIAIIMSTVTTDFITTTKKIVAEVRGVLTTLHLIREDVKSIRDQVASGNQPTPSNQQQSDGVTGGSKLLNAHKPDGNTGDGEEDIQPYLSDLKQRFFKNLRKPRFIIEILAVAGGIAYTIAAYNQLGVMNDTLRLERPWLGPDGTIVSVLGPKDQTPIEGQPTNWNVNHLYRLRLPIANGGRTPATNVRYDLIFKIGQVYDASEETASTPLPTDETCDKGELAKQYGGGVIMPIQGLTTHFIANVTQDVASNFDDIVNNKVGLYAVGCVDYSDTSGKPRYRTRFRFVFSPKESEPFAMTRFGNEAW